MEPQPHLMMQLQDDQLVERLRLLKELLDLDLLKMLLELLLEG